ncbi:MAG: hypothetical protein ACOYM3_04780 [Terrimicrobiaceae bacterium]
MAIMTHRTTFALDETTTLRLKRLAALWNVSQAEVVRRSVETAENQCSSDSAARRRIQAARELRHTMAGSKINIQDWLRLARDSRR